MLATWSGDIPNGTIWSNTEVQQVVGDVRIPAGSRLTIQPGTIVKFTAVQLVDITVEGTLLAQGTAGQPIIFTSLADDVGGDTNGDGNATSPLPGQFDGLVFNATSAGSMLDNVEVRYGGRSNVGAVLVNGGPLTMTNSKIVGSLQHGLRIQNSNPTIQNILFKDNQIFAASMDLASNPAISGVTMQNNTINALRVDSGALPSNGSWNDPDITYYLDSSVTVPEGRILTIGAGQVVKFASFNVIGIRTDGTLLAQGTAAQPIVVTAITDDTVGGDTNNDGNATSPAPGRIDGLQFNATSTGNVLSNVEVRYGGQNMAGAVFLNGGSLTMTDSKVIASARHGMRIQNSNPTISGVLFKDSAEAALSMDLASNPAISGVTMQNNIINALRVDSGSLPASNTWNDPGITYYLDNSVTVPAGRTLTIGAGQVVKFASFNVIGIRVDGTLTAQGTTAQPIYFTAVADDSVGGDTNNNGNATSPNRGQLDGLQFNATSTGNVLDHVEVRYGGQNMAGAIFVNGGPLTLTNSKVIGSNRHGMRIQTSDPVIIGVHFQDSADAALSMDLASNPAISGVTMFTNTVNGLQVDGGTLSEDGFWDDSDITYLLNSSVTVPTGTKLTIGAGQVVKFASFNVVGIRMDGTLLAQGTAAQPIIITAATDDTVGGDTNNDENATSPAPGRLDGLQFNATSIGNVLGNVEVRFGGQSMAGAVFVNGGPLSLTNSKIISSARAGLRVQNAVPTVSNVSFLNNAEAAISINLAADVATSGIVATGNTPNAVAIDGGTLAADRVWNGQGLPYQLNGDITVPAGLTLTVGAGVTLETLANRNLLGAGSIANAGLIRKSAGVTTTIAPALVNTGTVKLLSGLLNLTGGVANNGSGVLSGPAGLLTRIGKDLIGNTQNAAAFAPLATIQFNGAGTPAAPQLWEALSNDLGASGAGFEDNLAFYSVELMGSTYVKLVDNANNAPGTGAEAIYLASLVVPAGSTLDLNGLHLYVRSTQITGALANGNVTVLPDGGPLGRDAVTPGRISVAGETDDWTIFGRAGEILTVTVSTGSGGATPPINPPLSFSQITILDANNNVLGTASNTTSGADVTLAGIALPADGTYHIRVKAPSAQAAATGNYVITAWNATVNEFPLQLGTQVTGNIDNPFRIDRWKFSAPAGQIVKFSLLAAESSAIQFDLTGPNGFTAFSNANASSGDIALPAAGEYAVSVHSSNRQTGAYAFRVDQTAVTTLTLGTPLNVPLAGGSQSQLFQFNVPQSQQLIVSLTDNNAADRNEVYVKYGSPPTRSDFQYKFSNPASANQSVDIPSAAPGTWFVLVYTDSAPQPGSYTLKADGGIVFLRRVEPRRVSTSTDAVFTLTGLGLNSATGVSLFGNNLTIPATSVQLDHPTQITATFAAGSVPQGTYSMRLSNATADLFNSITFVDGGQPKFTVSVESPGALGYHNPSTLLLRYGNKGDAAMPAPLLMFTPVQTHANGVTDAKAYVTLDQSRQVAGFYSAAPPTGFSHSIQILASGKTPGVLQPGESIEVPVYWAGWQEPWDLNYPPFSFDVRAAATTETTAFDWNAMKAALSPPEVEPEAWGVVWANMQLQMGDTWGSYIAALDNTASYLNRLGTRVSDVASLFSFQLALADGLTISPAIAAKTDATSPAPGLPLTFTRSFSSLVDGRYRIGPLGRGWSWTENWDGVLTVQTDGTVLIRSSAGVETVFNPDSRGGYSASPGDFGKLVALGGGKFQVQEADGSLSAYRSDGRVDFHADPNGNRITAGYTGGKLTSLSHSSGQDFQIAYNAAGRITSVTDDVGRVTQYAYDAANEHLLTVTDFDGQVTTYAYDTGSSAATRHALLSVTNPDGTHEFFSYDSRGRLSETKLDANAERLQFTYGAIGQVIATDALGGVAKVFFNHRGRVAKTEDPLGRQTFYSYDSAANLISTVDAAGQRTTFANDAHGNRTRITNPLGQSLQMTYGIFDQITSFTDAKGNAIRYAYDAKGNLTTTTYADGSIESLAYDPIGNLINSTDRRGQATQNTYNAAGLLLSRTFADNSQVTYVYDARANLTTATDASGTVTLEYDQNDRLKQITYPGNRFLKYTYDAAGRRTQMTDQTSFTVNYAYNAVGRLASLKDSTNAIIVSYSYDAGGQLLRKDHGNQTYTTYEYDLAGQLLHLVNRAPDNSVSSRFDYTYDLMGQAQSMTTLDGAWTYTYDAIGQLTRAVFLSANPGVVPSQDLAYQYDAAGNRTSTVTNGVTTAYVSNSLNQYTSIGAASFVYDVNGNLTQKTEGGTTTAYAYNLQNRLTGITLPGDGWAFQYDALGNLIAETHAGQTVRNLIDPAGLGDVVGRFNGAGALIAHFVHGLGLVSRVDANGTAAFYNFDSTANAVALTGVGGAVVNAYRYLPFGASLTTSETIVNPFQFGGEEGVMVAAPGLSFMRARYYDAAAGRFTQMDPINIAGGPNLYVYADNDPVNQTDPTGLAPTFASPAAEALYLRLLAKGRAALDYVPKRAIEKALDGRVLKNAGPRVAKTVIATTATQTTKTVVAAGVGSIFTRPLTFTKLGALGFVILVDVANSLGHFIGDRFEWRQKWDDLIYERFPITSAIGESITDPFILNVFSKDPNDKLGPDGFGASGFVTGDGVFPYRINFENDKNASAPAQVVRITDQLSDKLDWDTFQLTEVGFGDVILSIPEDSQHFQTSVPLTQNGKTFDVLIEAGLRASTGEVFAIFQSLDPLTELPPDVLLGFLPPEDETGRGQGHISYTIKPKLNLSTGTQIKNIALIKFDFNESIATNQIDPHDPTQGVDAAKEARVTIDSGSPTSAITPLRLLQPLTFAVNWAGLDDVGGSGIGAYDVYVSTDGGPFQTWLSGTNLTSSQYTGVEDHSYSFYSVATDNVGHRQSAPVSAQATTIVRPFPWHNPVDARNVDGKGGITTIDAVMVISYLNSPAPAGTGPVPESAFDALIPAGQAPPLGFIDVAIAGSHGGLISVLDALLVINYLNSPNPEGESDVQVTGASLSGSPVPEDPRLTDLINLLAFDLTEQASRRQRRR